MASLSHRVQQQLLAGAGLLAVILLYVWMVPIAPWTPDAAPRATAAGNRSQLPSYLTPPGSCTCQTKAAILKNSVDPKELHDLERRRAQEMKKYRLRNQSAHLRLLYAPANSPLQYPIQGFTVRPLTPTAVPDLGLDAGQRNIYEVTLSVSRGVLTTNVLEEEVEVQGGGTKEITIVSVHQEALNLQLMSMLYASSSYHVNTEDYVTFRFEDHETVFPIAIQQPKIPVLSDMGTDINSHVTILTKTFMRYQKLRALLQSIRLYYPKMRVIVADDSIKTETVEGENVEHYVMSPGKGWFAGRNLAISQAITKYFLWVDDDFLFSKSTKIEKFVEVMEANPQLDMVAGSVQGIRYHFSFLYEEGEEAEGGCIHVKFGKRFQTLPGYPKCSLVNGVANFFLARTDSIRQVGFDPKFNRVAHQELFMDGLGSLMIATCDYPESMYILHQPHKGNGAAYNKFRYIKQRDFAHRYSIYFFKNNLKCVLF